MVKWGSTTCTQIKWGSTVCTVVKWGSTIVFPDAGTDGSTFIGLFSTGFNVSCSGNSATISPSGNITSGTALNFTCTNYYTKNNQNYRFYIKSINQSIDFSQYTKFKINYTYSVSNSTIYITLTKAYAQQASGGTIYYFNTDNVPVSGQEYSISAPITGIFYFYGYFNTSGQVVFEGSMNLNISSIYLY